MISLAIWWNMHLLIFQIAPALRARAIFVVFEEFSCAYLHQNARDIMLLPVLTTLKVCNYM